jgi:hypothetical protein
MNAVVQLEQEWPALHGQLANALSRWRSEQRPLRPFGSAQQLLRFLHAGVPAQTDAPLLALLTLGRDDRLAGRFVLQAILPGLKAQAARLGRGADSREELWELLLFYAWEAICCYPLERRPRQVAANLVLQVLHDTSRELSCPANKRERPCPAAALEHLTAQARYEQLAARRGIDAETLLETAAVAGVISERDVQLILRTRVDGIRLQLLARIAGVAYPSLLKRRQRAEAAIRRWLASDRDVRKSGPEVLTCSATSQPVTRPDRHRTRPVPRMDRSARLRRDRIRSRTAPGRRHA